MPNRLRAAAQAWEALMRTHAALLTNFEDAGDFDPLSAREYDVLFVLARAGGSLPMRDLVEGALLSQPSMSRMVERLSAKGYLVRTPNSGDRRAVDVALTREGSQMQQRIGRQHVRTIAKELAPLTIDEMAQLEHLCSKLRRNEE